MTRHREGDAYVVTMTPLRSGRGWAVSVLDKNSYACVSDTAPWKWLARIQARLIIRSYKNHEKPDKREAKIYKL